MNAPQTLVLLGTQMETAGAQKVLLNQAAWFHAKGYKVLAVFFYDKQKLLPLWQEKHPFPIIDLQAYDPHSNPLSKVVRLLGGLGRLWRILRKEKVTMIETFTPDSNLLGIPVAWLARLSARVATHHTKIEGRPDWFPRLHGWLINSGMAHCLVAVSKKVAGRAIKIEGVQAERVHLILNGIEAPAPDPDPQATRQRIRQELNIDEDTPVILNVGRFTEQKGQSYLLEAVPQILEEYPSSTFLFAGDGPNREMLEEKAKTLRITESIRFLGIRGDVPQLLTASDIFALPSLWEGLPLAMLEAMSTGTPVVVTAVEGIDDVLEDGVNGLVVPIKGINEIAAALNKMIGDKALREKIGAAGRDTIKAKFNLDKMCQQYEELFLNLLKD